MGDLGFSIDKNAEREFVEKIRMKLRMLKYGRIGYQFTEPGNRYAFSILELLTAMRRIIKTDDILICSEIVKYLAKMVRRYGFLFGFESKETDNDELAQFIKRMSTDEKLVNLVNFYNIVLYFQYPVYVQMEKNDYDRAEVFAETMWNEIDKNGFVLVDTKGLVFSHMPVIVTLNISEYIPLCFILGFAAVLPNQLGF